jgi:hypothetical protein
MFHSQNSTKIYGVHGHVFVSVVEFGKQVQSQSYSPSGKVETPSPRIILTQHFYMLKEK